MPSDRRVTILLTTEEYDEVKARAGIASVSAYIKSELFKIPSSNPGRESEHVDSGSTESGGLKPPSDKPKSRKSELAEAVAGRTRHEIGCQCMHCIQAERFFKSMRKEE